MARLYITINDNDAIKTILGEDRWRKTWIRSALEAWDPPDSLLKLRFEKFGFHGEMKHAHVFYDTDYLRSHWGRFAKIETVVPNAYGFQTAYVLSHCPIHLDDRAGVVRSKQSVNKRCDRRGLREDKQSANDAEKDQQRQKPEFFSGAGILPKLPKELHPHKISLSHLEQKFNVDLGWRYPYATGA